MWTRLADFIIKNRLALILFIGLVTVFMAYNATKVEMSYDFNKIVPPRDSAMMFFEQFKKQFGEDANVVAIGLKDSAIYQYNNFTKYKKLCDSIRTINGVTQVIALPVIKIIEKDTANRRFNLISLFPSTIQNQYELDSLLGEAGKQKFYLGQIVNESNGSLAMLVAIKKEVAESARRVDLTNAVLKYGHQFTDDTSIDLHYAGLVFVRSVVASQVSRELNIFLYLSALVTGVIMFLFFRSFRAVLFSMIIITIVVIWVLGTLALLNYKITLLSGLIPPVIVTIGITNCIYLLNKYHLEYVLQKDKMKAIQVVVHRMGLATFLTNLTVAIGFITLLATDIPILREFGVVAGINVMVLFFVSLVMIPSIFSWLPEPSHKHLRHLEFKLMGRSITLIDALTRRHRVAIYIVTVAVVLVSAFGMSKLESVSYMVDDLPEGSVVKQDLKFFETNFSGIMPLEIVINTGRRRGILDVRNLQKINELEMFLDSLPEISKPVSIISFVKASKQAYYNNNPDRYSIPTRQERDFILRYLRNQSDDSGLFKSFADSTFQKMRVSMQMADIGSKQMDILVDKIIKPKINQLFEGTEITAEITGTSLLFIKGNKFLINNLQESLLLAFILISLSMAILFANVRMIIISIIPNVIALMITAGIMGYLDIKLKASTALIFSITFGISVDNSIRFLAKYRQELLHNKFFIPVSVTETIMETGKSIIYTSIVLFVGFVIFAGSSFGSTIALGILTSTTLVISMFTNLILLPALILTFDKAKIKKDEHLIIDDFDPSFYGESNAEEIAKGSS